MRLRSGLGGRRVWPVGSGSKLRWVVVWTWSVLALVLLAACGASNSGYQVVVDGLNHPRGLVLRADGTLCVAEAGRLAVGQEPKEGPTANLAATGAVTCVDSTGRRTAVVEGLPFVFYNVTGVTTGPADLVEMEGDLFLLTGEGHVDPARSILRISAPPVPPVVVADLLAFATETAVPGFFDEIDVLSNPYAMVSDPQDRRFLVTDGATGQIMAAGLDGRIQIFSQVEGHEVLTGIIWGPDGLYVASFSQLPHAEGTGAILRFDPDGSFDVVIDDVTTPIDLAFDTKGRLYVLEFVSAAEFGFPYPARTGRLLRFDRRGDGWSNGLVLVEGLPFPTALLIDDQDRGFVSVHGAFSSPESGLVIRFDDLAGESASGFPLEY